MNLPFESNGFMISCRIDSWYWLLFAKSLNMNIPIGWKTHIINGWEFLRILGYHSLAVANCRWPAGGWLRKPNSHVLRGTGWNGLNHYRCIVVNTTQLIASDGDRWPPSAKPFTNHPDPTMNRLVLVRLGSRRTPGSAPYPQLWIAVYYHQPSENKV